MQSVPQQLVSQHSLILPLSSRAYTVTRMTVHHRPGLAVLACLAPIALAGCAPSGPTVATFEVAGQETYRIELATPELIRHARQLMAGEDVGRIPNGRIVRDDSGADDSGIDNSVSDPINAPWSWHIDPATLEFADFTTEVCDGLPQYVEDGTLTSDYFCPWSAEIIAIDGPG